ncbi:MAG: flagellar hook-basal body protein [Angelakisella sp.]|nr:flagellar hook-basal body protein [Angelakisella sp.]
MNISFFTGVSGMVSYQKSMDVIAHNIANVNTTGFKPMKSSFSDLLYSQMDTNGENENGHIVGHGVRVQGNDLMYQQGNIVNTGRALDFALVGDAFFAVERGENTEYTRNGSFSISAEGSKGYLVTMDGEYVLDAKGKRIELDKKENSELFDLTNVHEKLGIYTFPNPFGLSPTDSASFMQTAISGEAEAVRNIEDMPCDLVQFSLESSSVDLSQQMADVIINQKAFQFNAKIVQTADQLEEIVNSLR